MSTDATVRMLNAMRSCSSLVNFRIEIRSHHTYGASFCFALTSLITEGLLSVTALDTQKISQLLNAQKISDHSVLRTYNKALPLLERLQAHDPELKLVEWVGDLFFIVG